MPIAAYKKYSPNFTRTWAAGVCLFSSAAVAVPDALVEALPAEPIAVWMLEARPPQENAHEGASVVNLATLLLQRGREMGLFPRLEGTAAWTAEILALLPTVSRYPRALVLLDVAATDLPDGGHRLGGLQAGLILLTAGDHLLVERRIQSALNLHTDSAHTRLTTHEAEGRKWNVLRDDRLPDWAPFAWGAVGPFYLVTVGTGAWERAVSSLAGEAPGLGRDDWFRNSHGRCRGSAARWEWYVDVARLRRRLDPVMPEQAEEVLKGVRLDEVTRGVWTVGPDCRAVDAACMLRLGDRDRYIPMTVTGAEAAAFDAVIPPQASSAAIIRAEPQDLIQRFRSAYLFSKSPAERKRLMEWWGEMESDLGVKAREDLLDHLGDHVIIHDFPRHPLNLPLFRTLLLEIGGSADAVRAALDRLLGRAQSALRSPDSSGPRALDFFRLNRDADGVWYVQLGIYGPALAVTDRWIVISHSPQAVRENVRFLAPQAEDSDPEAPIPSTNPSPP